MTSRALTGSLAAALLAGCAGAGEVGPTTGTAGNGMGTGGNVGPTGAVLTGAW